MTETNSLKTFTNSSKKIKKFIDKKSLKFYKTSKKK